MTMTATETKYFQILGGNTVLQLDSSGWNRWDFHDGVVPTSIRWDESSSKLKRISFDEAVSLMK